MRAIDVDEHERDGVGVAPRFRGLDPKTLEDAPSARGAGRGVNRRSMLELHPLQLDGLPCSQQFGDGAPQLARQSQRVVRLGRDAFHLGPVGSREERDGAQLDLAVARAARSSEHREDCRQGHRHQSRHQVCRARPRETERQRAGRQPSKPLRSAAVRISHRRCDGGDGEKRRAAGREAQRQQQNRRTQKTHGGCQLEPSDAEGPPRAAAAAEAESAPRPVPSSRSRRCPSLRKPRPRARSAAVSPASARRALIEVVSHEANSAELTGSESGGKSRRRPSATRGSASQAARRATRDAGNAVPSAVIRLLVRASTSESVAGFGERQ